MACVLGKGPANIALRAEQLVDQRQPSLLGSGVAKAYGHDEGGDVQVGTRDRDPIIRWRRLCCALRALRVTNPREEPSRLSVPTKLDARTITPYRVPLTR